MPKSDRKKDTCFVYGVGCTWFGSIHETKLNSAMLPCCPYCFSILMEVESEDRWWIGAERYEAAGHIGYVAMMKWARQAQQRNKMCFKTMTELTAAYEARPQ